MKKIPFIKPKSNRIDAFESRVETQCSYFNDSSIFNDLNFNDDNEEAILF